MAHVTPGMVHWWGVQLERDKGDGKVKPGLMVHVLRSKQRPRVMRERYRLCPICEMDDSDDEFHGCLCDVQ